MRKHRELAEGAARLDFRLLGAPSARRDGEPLDLGSPQQQAILAVLLLHGDHAVSTQELIDAVWGEDSPPQALAALRTYVSRLRQALEPDRPSRAPAEFLISVPDGYALRLLPESLDVSVFEQRVADATAARAEGDAVAAQELLTESLAQWHGSPLAGVPGPYAESQRKRLAEQRLVAQETWFEGELALGRSGEAVPALTVLATEHPLREGLRALLMLALYRSGRQAEALGVYADTRRLLIDELGVEPGPELAEVRSRILAADTDLLAAPASAVPDAAVAAKVVPGQLPADIGDFTGRGRLVSELGERLQHKDSSAVVISALAGIGGVGKTTLAVHVAHQLRTEFPDGQLYIDLRGAGSVPSDPHSVLADFLGALGIPAGNVPERLEQRSALYRSLLADRRMLILLDNARDASQVRPLLPGVAGCSVLVTTRSRMTGLPGAQVLDVEVLDPEESIAMFAAIAGEQRVAAEPEAAREVVAACAYLPLAVRIVASRLAARRNWTVATLAARLADERSRLDELQIADLAVETTFHLGYTQLKPRQARAFRLLSLGDGPDFSLAAAAVVLDLGLEEAEDLLASLVDVGLLEEPALDRYRYHDLLRLFARRQSAEADTDEERSAAMSRLTGFLLATIGHAFAALEPDELLAEQLSATAQPGQPLGSPAQAVSWLTAERATLLAVAAQSAAEGGVGQLRQAVDLLLAWVWLMDGGEAYHSEFRRTLTALGEAAHRHGDVRSEARAREVLGTLYYQGGDYGQAQAEARTVLELTAEGADPAARYLAANRLGIVLGTIGQLADALPYFEESHALCRTFGNFSAEAVVLANLARAQIAADRMDLAVATARQAVSTAELCRNLVVLADTRYQLGLVLYRTGRPDEASAVLLDALPSFASQQRERMLGLTQARLAESLLACGRAAESLHHAEQALALGHEITGWYGNGLAQSALGQALLSLGEADRGRSCLVEAQAIFERLGVPEAKLIQERLDQAGPPVTG
jgi:DNA-binding SARP family transcriptional activator/tetratricopeptide (TPR) repeat protein